MLCFLSYRSNILMPRFVMRQNDGSVLHQNSLRALEQHADFGHHAKQTPMLAGLRDWSRAQKKNDSNKRHREEAESKSR